MHPPPLHLAPPRKGHHADRQARQGQAPSRPPWLSRMALEQPDDTPYDQRLLKMQAGPRQMA